MAGYGNAPALIFCLQLYSKLVTEDEKLSLYTGSQ